MQLRPGQRVRITNVDMYGFCGRDRHPEKHHIGREGVVCSICDSSDDPEEGSYICYDVRLDDGQMLELMDFEIEPL